MSIVVYFLLGAYQVVLKSLVHLGCKQKYPLHQTVAWKHEHAPGSHTEKVCCCCCCFFSLQEMNNLGGMLAHIRQQILQNQELLVKYKPLNIIYKAWSPDKHSWMCTVLFRLHNSAFTLLCSFTNLIPIFTCCLCASASQLKLTPAVASAYWPLPLTLSTSYSLTCKKKK